MAELLIHGQKIKYLHEGKWQDGIIHGVKIHEKHDGQIMSISYLIDTGDDERVDEYRFDQLDREVNQRANALVKKGGHDFGEAIAEVIKQSDLPKSKVIIDKVRQPKQIELDQKLVKAS